MVAPPVILRCPLRAAWPIPAEVEIPAPEYITVLCGEVVRKKIYDIVIDVSRSRFRYRYTINSNCTRE